MGDYVYFLQRASGGPIKIGCSWSPEQRALSVRSQIQEPVVLLGVIARPDLRRMFPVERALKHRFAAHCVGGEWFEETPELVALIAQCAEGLDTPRTFGWLDPPRGPRRLLRIA